MHLKTLSDCKECLMVKECDAHINSGSWKHSDGDNSCILDFESEANDFQNLK